jgi:predicted phosphodiesterase
MKFSALYVSDLHLETRNNENRNKILSKIIKSKDKTRYVLICGDLGYPFEPYYFVFLEKLSQVFEKIFLIAGNHEYYKPKEKKFDLNGLKEWIEYVNNYIRENKPENVIFLQDTYYELDNGVILYGSTYWTDGDFDSCKNVLNDFFYIPGFNGPEINSINSESKESLKKTLMEHGL